jgi:hypothetical protein
MWRLTPLGAAVFIAAVALLVVLAWWMGDQDGVASTTVIANVCQQMADKFGEPPLNINDGRPRAP